MSGKLKRAAENEKLRRECSAMSAGLDRRDKHAKAELEAEHVNAQARPPVLKPGA